MANPKQFFQDRTMLLIGSVETFVMLFTAVVILLRLDAIGEKTTFVTQFRSEPNAVDFVSGGMGINGSISEVISFIVATILFYVVGVVLAYHAYKLRRELALVVLALTFILQLFVLAVANILLALR